MGGDQTAFRLETNQPGERNQLGGQGVAGEIILVRACLVVADE